MSSTSEMAEPAIVLTRRGTNLRVLGWACVLALFAYTYYPVAVTLVDVWSASTQTYSYGFLIPVVSAALIWMRRDELRRIPVVPSLGWGAAVTSIGLVVLFAGRLSTLSVLQEFSLLVTICGLTLLMFGRRMLRALAFPIGYLIAMIPVWDVLTMRVHPYFQDFSARIGTSTLQAFGVPVFRHGFFIELPNITLEVAQECSGVNNLIAVLGVGVPMAYLFLRKWWKRVVILTAAVLIAIISNGARVAMVSLFAYYGIRGADGDIHGPFSLLRSLMVSTVGFVALFWLISRFGDDGAPIHARALRPAAPARRPGPARRLTAVAVAVVMLAAANGLIAWYKVARVPLRVDLATFPSSLALWESRQGTSSNALASLGFDHRLSRAYVASDGQELNLFIGYYESQGPGRELADYRMRERLLGRTGVPSKIVAGDAKVTDLITSQGGQRHHVTYWYVLQGRIVSADYEAKLHTAWNSLAHRRSDGAVVAVSTPLRGGDSLEIARARVRDFLDALIAAERLYLPAS